MADQPELLEVSYFTFNVEDFANIEEFLDCMNGPEAELLIARLQIPTNDTFVVAFEDPEDDDDETSYDVHRNELGVFVAEISEGSFGIVEGNDIEYVDMETAVTMN